MLYAASMQREISDLRVWQQIFISSSWYMSAAVVVFYAPTFSSGDM